MIILWIGTGGWPLHYDGFPEAEVMAAAKRLDESTFSQCCAVNRRARIQTLSPSIRVGRQESRTT